MYSTSIFNNYDVVMKMFLFYLLAKDCVIVKTFMFTGNNVLKAIVMCKNINFDKKIFSFNKTQIEY